MTGLCLFCQILSRQLSNLDNWCNTRRMSALSLAQFDPPPSSRSSSQEKVKSALDVWASLLHHRAAGGGGWPLLGDCLERVSDTGPLLPSRHTIKEAEEDGPCATRVPVVDEACDQRTLLVSACVHASLNRRECPRSLKAFLLLRHPREGRFQPPRSLAHFDEGEAALKFVRAWPEGQAMVGRLACSRTNSEAARLLRSLYSRLIQDLESDLGGF